MVHGSILIKSKTICSISRSKTCAKIPICTNDNEFNKFYLLAQEMAMSKEEKIARWAEKTSPGWAVKFGANAS